MLPPFIAGACSSHPHGSYRKCRESSGHLPVCSPWASSWRQCSSLSVFAGLATITALALGILSAGVVGIVSFTMRRPRKPSAADEIAAMMAPQHASGCGRGRVSAVGAGHGRRGHGAGRDPRGRPRGEHAALAAAVAPRGPSRRPIPVRNGQPGPDALHGRSDLPVRRADRPLRGRAAARPARRGARPADRRPRLRGRGPGPVHRTARSSRSTARTASGAGSIGRPSAARCRGAGLRRGRRNRQLDALAALLSSRGLPQA